MNMYFSSAPAGLVYKRFLLHYCFRQGRYTDNVAN